MATMLVTAIAAPQPTYSTSSTCQLIIRTRIPSHRCSPLLLCGFCPCVGYVGVVCVAYKNTFRAADPAHVPEVLFAVEKDPRCYRVESCRVESSYMCGGKAALVLECGSHQQSDRGLYNSPPTSDAVSVQGLSGRGWSDQEVSGGTTPSHPEIDPPGGGVERGSAVQEEVSLVLHEHMKGSSVYSREINLRKVLRVNYQEPEVPKDDDYFFCDECRTFFLEECEVHGPIVFMADRPVAVREKDRAKKTLPAGFEIRNSGIPGAGLGVFYCGDGGLPIGTHFGPYEGHRTDEEGALESGYSWEIYKSRHSDYIDAKRETLSNWMRYVNCARNEEERNLIAFQHKGGILYRTCGLVTELLVWYGDEYARHLGIGFDRLWNNKSSTKGGRSQLAPAQAFPCPECPYSYTSQIFLHKHMKRSHGDLYGRLLRSGEIKVEPSLLPYVAASYQEPIGASPGTVQSTSQIPAEGAGRHR